MQQDFSKKIDAALKHLKELNAYNSITWRNLFKYFLYGVFYALGATIGLAIVVAILGFIIKLGGGLPGVGSFFVNLGNFLHK